MGELLYDLDVASRPRKRPVMPWRPDKYLTVDYLDWLAREGL